MKKLGPLTDPEILKDLEHGDRLKVIGQCIFGTFCGFMPFGFDKVCFYDEELGTTETYPTKQLERTYERW